MSTRTYALRSRTDAGVATQPRTQNNSTARQPSLSPSRDPPPHMAGRFPLSSAMPALYSEVVSPRVPSPMRENPSGTVELPVRDTSPERPQVGRMPLGLTVVPTVSRENITGARENDTSSDKSNSPEDPGNEPWTTIKRRRARSLESYEPVRKSPSGNIQANVLTVDQIQAVHAATTELTTSQKEKLKRRHKKMTHRRTSSSSSRGEGASKPKGKGIDPLEWGNVNISRESLDIDAQAAAWKSITRNKGRNRQGDVRKAGTHRVQQGNIRSPSEQLPAASRPVAQLPKDSYLGLTLRNIGRSHSARRVPPDGGETPSSSEPSSSEEYSESDSSYSEERPRRRRDNMHGRNGRRRRKSSGSSSKLVIKPIAPKEYSGGADARAYHRFVRESEAYLRDGKVKGRRRIFLLSHYLTNKAYDFYTQKVANDEANWTLTQFYEELFNYCFPVDYRMQLRRTLARCHQNDKSVAEYTHELSELFNMIGNIPERDQVLKFWNGTRSVIQKGLWRDNLNPETSSWARVVAQAEIIEISENVAERRDRRHGSSSQQGVSSNLNPHGASSNRSKNRNMGNSPSVRSVSFESKGTSQSGSGDKSRSGNTHGSDSRTQTSHGRGNSRPPRGRFSSRGRSQTPRSSSSHQNSAPRLTDKERADRIAAGQCFVCGGADHYSRDCPTKKVVRSNNGKPPGASSFSIEPAVEERDSDGVEVLDSLPVGAISLEPHQPISVEVMDYVPWPIAEWREHYPFWELPGIQARRMIGDGYLMVASTVLTLGQPYPGDDQFEPNDHRPETRFRIKVRLSKYEIYDALVGEGVSLERTMFKNPCFNLSRWYAVRRVKALGLDRSQVEPYKGPMGYALCRVAKKLLTDGIHTYYPGIQWDQDPYTRFEICPRNLFRHEYVITDKDQKFHTRITQAELEDPRFDLVGWYVDILDRRSQRAIGDECDSSPHLFVGCSQPDQESEGDGNESVYDDLPGLEPLFDDEGLDDPEYDDLPDLDPLSDDEDDDEPSLGPWYEDPDESNSGDMPDLQSVDDEGPSLEDRVDDYVSDDDFENEGPVESYQVSNLSNIELVTRLDEVLTSCQPFPGDGSTVDPTYHEGEDRFVFALLDLDVLEIYDRVQGFETHLSMSQLRVESFAPGRWFAERCAVNKNLPHPWKVAQEWTESKPGTRTTMWTQDDEDDVEFFTREMTSADSIDLGGVQVDRSKYPSLQRNSAQVKAHNRVLPKPVVVKIEINGHPVRALLDSGSLGDFISSTLVDQLSLTRKTLEAPLSLHLAVQGSRSKVNASTTVNLKYQGINESRTLDIINLNSYDAILGTPWMYQHQVCLGFNPARVVIGSDSALPVKTGVDTKLMAAMMGPEEQQVESVRDDLRRYAEPLCKEMDETDLPPLRAINHTIPLIDETKTYSWRPSKCPEAFRGQWAEKRNAYIKSGRWKITTTGNTVPMLLIPKPGTNPPLLRTVVDLRERNKNTRKVTSPLPDMDGMLRRTASKPFRSSLDLKNAYEQIRIVPEHVDRSSVTTPDGNMVSLVAQQGDCNAPATYQALMNFLFSSYIGRFMDVYLDDIVIYSDTLEEHVRHVKLILDILEREKLYLSRSKLHFIAPELKLLGRVIDDNGIRMDADKVDSVAKWKVPTNRDLLRGFIGSVGYLADDIPGVRIPMGVLSSITGDTVPFRWGYTEQRAFDEVKSLVHAARNHRRKPLDYSPGAPPIWMVTDGCATGISGVVSQGPDWKTARIAAFYSAKLNSAQQNYPVHEIEMLAGIETMLRYQDILQGTPFQWLTDHKGLTHLLNQKNLSGRQARWLEKISSFTFTVTYIEGSENVVADALSRLYSFDSPGTQRSRSEFTYHDVIDDDTSSVVVRLDTDTPILAGIEARLATRRSSRVRRPTEKAAWALSDSVDDDVVTVSTPSRKPPVKDRSPPRDPPEGGNTAENTAEPTQTTDLLIRQEFVETPLLTKSAFGLDILAELRGQYENDITFRPILDKPGEFRNFKVEDGLIYLKKNDKYILCIPKSLIQGRSAREMIISEAHSLLAHLGASKTLDYLRDNVWWRDMVTDVKAFCETCNTCKMSKPSNQKPYGLLNPLAVPSYPWESIGIDFVGPLPESRNRDGQFDSITVVICLLTAMVHLIPSRINYNATQLAELVFENVYKLHGLPQRIISDRDVLFTSTFWTRLHRLIGTRLRLSSAYHPQSDGSTERANRTVTQMLRQCIQPDQRDWVGKLPAIEFAINSARSESTGFAPFFLNYGRMPRTMIWNAPPPDEYPSVREFAVQRKLAIMTAHDSIIAARIKQTRGANRKRQDVPFKLGDLVYLSAQNISFKKGLARKLLPKFIGPYKIVRDYENNSFQLDLPAHLKRRGIHDVFHSSLLRIHIPNDDRLFPGRMDTQLSDDFNDDEWAVDRILSHHGSRTDATFEILWKSGDVTWLPYYQITHLQALTDYLELLKIAKISKLPAGRGRPPADDPQVFLGFIAPEVPHDLIIQTVSSFFGDIFSSLKNFVRSYTFVTYFFFPPSFISPTVDIELTPTMTPPRGIAHPCFLRLSATHYLITTTSIYFDSTIHVGQIADYLNFEASLRELGDLGGLQSMPLGYLDFAKHWNHGTAPGDLRRLSSFSFPDNEDNPVMQLSSNPVSIDDFFITPDQVGLRRSEPSASPDPISNGDDFLRNFASIMMTHWPRPQGLQEEVIHPVRRGPDNRQYDRRQRRANAGPLGRNTTTNNSSINPMHPYPSHPVDHVNVPPTRANTPTNRGRTNTPSNRSTNALSRLQFKARRTPQSVDSGPSHSGTRSSSSADSTQVNMPPSSSQDGAHIKRDSDAIMRDTFPTTGGKQLDDVTAGNASA